MATTNITIRMDADIKKEADQLFSELGMNLTTAIHVFISCAVKLRSSGRRYKAQTA